MSFTPGEVKVPKTAQGQLLTASGRISTARMVKVKLEAIHGCVSSLRANSVPELVTPRVTYLPQTRSSHGAIGEPSSPNALADALGQMSLGSAPNGHYRFSTIAEGLFTSDESTQRAIKISVGFGNGSLAHLQMRFNVSQTKVLRIIFGQLTSKSDGHVSFFLRNSCSQPGGPRFSLGFVLRRS